MVSLEKHVYAWGKGSDFQLGVGKKTVTPKPEILQNIPFQPTEGVDIKAVSCGSAHSFLIYSQK